MILARVFPPPVVKRYKAPVGPVNNRGPPPSSPCLMTHPRRFTNVPTAADPIFLPRLAASLDTTHDR